MKDAIEESRKEQKVSCENIEDVDSPSYQLDKGYSWVIFLIGFFNHVAGVGTAFSAGAFTPVLLEEFPHSKEAVGLIGSLHIGFTLFAGPLAGVLAGKFGYRKTIMGGAVLAAMGVASGAAAADAWILCMTVGVAGGTGISIVYIPSTSIVAAYFEKWKTVVLSVFAAGIGFGTMVMPLFMRWAIEEYGWRGAYLLIAGVILQVVVSGMLILPTPQLSTNKSERSQLTIKKELSTLCNWRFNLILANCVLFGLGAGIVFVFLAEYGQQKGLSSFRAIYLISILGIGNAIGRFLNILTNLAQANPVYVYIISCALSGVTVCLMNLKVSNLENCFYLLATTSALYGLLYGVQLANLAAVASCLSSEILLNSAFGLVSLFNGIGFIFGSPVAATILSVGNVRFEILNYFAGGITIIAGVMVVPIILK